MMIQENRNVASFKTIIEILHNDPSRVRLFRRLENARKKIINNECAMLFNKTWINERSHIYIYIYWLKNWSEFPTIHYHKPFWTQKRQHFPFSCIFHGTDFLHNIPSFFWTFSRQLMEANFAKPFHIFIRNGENCFHH